MNLIYILTSYAHVCLCVIKKNAIKQVDKGREAESALHI
jgi:hypothetical protein